ncbi:MAG: hypothetical protein ACOYL9_12860, partial [Ilumatobacteraceae bacterium]
MSTTVFTARKIVTMNPANPEATAVAVRDGMIIAAGAIEECASWGPHTVDDRFADKVLIPGFVEEHGRGVGRCAGTVHPGKPMEMLRGGPRRRQPSGQRPRSRCHQPEPVALGATLALDSQRHRSCGGR